MFVVGPSPGPSARPWICPAGSHLLFPAVKELLDPCRSAASASVPPLPNPDDTAGSATLLRAGGLLFPASLRGNGCVLGLGEAVKGTGVQSYQRQHERRGRHCRGGERRLIASQ